MQTPEAKVVRCSDKVEEVLPHCGVSAMDADTLGLVESWTEWDQLREVWVGSLDACRCDSGDPSFSVFSCFTG